MQNKKQNFVNLLALYKHKTKLGRADEEDMYFKKEKVNENITVYDEDDDGEYIDIPDRVCPDDEFECVADHECVALEKRCDNHTDCSDSSDEHECANNYSPFSDVAHFMPAPTGVPEADSNATTGTKGDRLQFGVGWTYPIFVFSPAFALELRIDIECN